MVMITTKVPNLVMQWIALKKAFPNSAGGVHRNRFRWSTELQPTSLSDVYTISVSYSLERSPKVFVKKPELQDRDGKRAPHRYRDGSLCLYLPAAREWQRSMYLAETIIPWTSEWLLHYEIWLATGEWCGGGIHPGDTLGLDKEPEDREPVQRRHGRRK